MRTLSTARHGEESGGVLMFGEFLRLAPRRSFLRGLRTKTCGNNVVRAIDSGWALGGLKAAAAATRSYSVTARTLDPTEESPQSVRILYVLVDVHKHLPHCGYFQRWRPVS